MKQMYMCKFSWNTIKTICSDGYTIQPKICSILCDRAQQRYKERRIESTEKKSNDGSIPTFRFGDLFAIINAVTAKVPVLIRLERAYEQNEKKRMSFAQ